MCRLSFMLCVAAFAMGASADEELLKLGKYEVTQAQWKSVMGKNPSDKDSLGDTCNGTEANCNGTKPFGTEKKGPNIGHAVSDKLRI